MKKLLPWLIATTILLFISSFFTSCSSVKFETGAYNTARDGRYYKYKQQPEKLTRAERKYLKQLNGN